MAISQRAPQGTPPWLVGNDDQLSGGSIKATILASWRPALTGLHTGYRSGSQEAPQGQPSWLSAAKANSQGAPQWRLPPWLTGNEDLSQEAPQGLPS